jgi:segregation and condensation protein B
MRYDSALEAILFYKREPIGYDTLQRILGCSSEELAEAIVTLEERLAGGGIQLVRDRHTVELATHPDASDMIRTMRKQEMTAQIGKAGLETLTIILYQAPVSRRAIDYIRGVNSGQMLRNLLMRGLIRKHEDESGGRAVYYEPTTDLLKYLGISSPEDLPEAHTFRSEIAALYDMSE